MKSFTFFSTLFSRKPLKAFALLAFTLLITKQDFGQTFGLTSQGTTNYPETNVGYTLNQTGNNAGNYLIFDSVTVTNPLTATGIGSFGTASGTISVSIYTDNSGTPGTKLFTEVSGTTSANSTSTIDIPNTYLAAGKYWIAYDMNSNSSSANYITKNTLSNGVVYRKAQSYSYGTVFPSSASSLSSLANLAANTQDNIFIIGVPIQGYAKATKATLPGTASSITSVSFYASALGNLRVAIYSNSGSAPSSKLWESGDNSVTSTGLKTINISSGTPTTLTNLSSGTYWLVWQWSPTTSPTFGPSYTAGTAGSGNYRVMAYGSFPSTWSSGVSSSEEWTIYANYTKPNSTITVTGSTTYTYNGSAQGPATATVTGSTGAVTYSYSGTSGTTYGPSATAPTNAGSYTATATVAADANYNSATSSAYAFSIAQKALIITANAQSKTYGTTQSSPVTGSAAFTSSGLVSGETIGSVTLTYGAGALTATSAAGSTSTITPSAATGGTFNANNYTITYTAGTLTVTKAPLTITANAQSKTYGTTQSSPATGSTAFSSSGLQNSETIGSVTLTYGSGGLTATSAAGSTSTITPSAATGGTFTASNYTITYTAGTLTVSKAPLTITANAQSKTYGTTQSSPVTGSTAFSSLGLQNSETIGSVTLTYGSGGLTAMSAAGSTSTITPSSATGGTFNASNYTITYTAGTLTVAKAPLTITAVNKTVNYGDAVPTLTYTSSGYVNGETSSVLSGSPSLSTTYTNTTLPSASPITISITAGSLTATNYTFSFVSGTVTINSTSSIWTGGTSTSWSTGSNWDGGTVPSSGASIIINSGASHYPALTSSVTVGSLSLQSGSTITIGANTLTINSSVSGSGTFTGSSSSSMIVANSGSNPILNFTSGHDTLFNLTLNNNATATLGTTLKLAAPSSGTPAKLSIGSSAVLNTSNLLTLVSDKYNTAVVSPVGTGGSVTGNVTVQRYFPARRAWRLITAPLTSSNDIYDAFQNSGIAYNSSDASTKCTGTLITNTGNITGTGIDVVSTASLKSFSYSNQALSNVTNTHTPVSAGNAGNADNSPYFIFIRGDRNPATIANPNNTAVPLSATTFNSKGKLQTGTQTFSFPAFASTHKFMLIGNPYASPIDFSNVGRTNIIKRFYIWDPTLNTVGAYVVVDDAINSGSYIVSTAGGVTAQNNNIQSGQAFFVEDSAKNLPCVLTFNESSKSSVNNNLVFRPATDGESFRTSLYLLNDDSSTVLADGNIVQYNNSFSADLDAFDAPKLGNINEIVSSFRNGSQLSIERRPIINSTDTIFLKLTNTSKRNYQFVFAANNLNHPGLHGALLDSYTGASTPLSLSGQTAVNFTIDSNATSQANNRFSIVFNSDISLPVTFRSIKAVEKGSNVNVSWNVENEINISEYEIERSVDGKTFTKVATQKASGASSYNWVDTDPSAGNNFYRIRSIGTNGKAQYSAVAKVVTGSTASGISDVYPNPVGMDQALNVQLVSLTPGSYKISLISSSGQTVRQNTFTITINADSPLLVIPTAGVATGHYIVSVEGVNQHYTKNVVIE